MAVPVTHCCPVAKSCPNLYDSIDYSTPGLPVLYLLKLMSLESVMPSSHLILCHSLLLLPSIFPSIRVFSNECSLYQVAKVLELQLQHQSFQWIFRVDILLDWLVWPPCSPRDHKSLLHSSKASVLWCSAFFMVQLSHPSMTTGKTIALPLWTSVGKVMSLLFNMLSRLVIAFLPRSKHLLISGYSHHLQWFWSPRK